eukprot:sb/3471408/
MTRYNPRRTGGEFGAGSGSSNGNPGHSDGGSANREEGEEQDNPGNTPPHHRDDGVIGRERRGSGHGKPTTKTNPQRTLTRQVQQPPEPELHRKKLPGRARKTAVPTTTRRPVKPRKPISPTLPVSSRARKTKPAPPTAAKTGSRRPESDTTLSPYLGSHFSSSSSSIDGITVMEDLECQQSLSL